MRSVRIAGRDDRGARRRGPYRADLREEALLGTLERLLRQKPLERIEVGELARALVWMNERCFYASTLDSRVAPSEEELVDTLSAIWYRAIYYGEPAGSNGPSSGA